MSRKPHSARTRVQLPHTLAREKVLPLVSAVVPAFQEAERIGTVLETLVSYPGFCEVIVVDDGSTDGTAEIAAKHGAKVIVNPENIGKAGAMDRGVKAAQGDVLFFVDADIRGLTHEMIRGIVEPVQSGECDMFVGMRRAPGYYLRFVFPFLLILDGLRAVKRELWDQVPDEFKRGFQIEAALGFYAKNSKNGTKHTSFKGITQTIKEKKFGMRKGLRRRIKMFVEVGSAYRALRKQDRAARRERLRGRIRKAMRLGVESQSTPAP